MNRPTALVKTCKKFMSINSRINTNDMITATFAASSSLKQGPQNYNCVQRCCWLLLNTIFCSILTSQFSYLISWIFQLNALIVVWHVIAAIFQYHTPCWQNCVICSNNSWLHFHTLLLVRVRQTGDIFTKKIRCLLRILHITSPKVNLWWWAIPKICGYLISRNYSNRKNVMPAKYTWFTVYAAFLPIMCLVSDI